MKKSMGAARQSTGAAATGIWGSTRAVLVPPTVAFFVAERRCWHRTRDNAAGVSAAVHAGDRRRCACATMAAMSWMGLAECSRSVPLDVAPGDCRPLSLSSSLQGIAGTAHRSMQLGSLLMYMMEVSCGALVRRWLPCR